MPREPYCLSAFCQPFHSIQHLSIAKDLTWSSWVR
jgi:hypothetical protein